MSSRVLDEAAPLLAEPVQDGVGQMYGTGDTADESALHPALASTNEASAAQDGKPRVSPLTVVRTVSPACCASG
jgi:hypothetical protein